MGDFLDKLLGREAERKLYLRIADDHVLTGDYSGNALVADQSYFEIRLTEMYLHNRQQFWRGFIPLGLAVTDFLYDRRLERVPFFVGNQVLKNIEKYLDGKYVEYRNTKVAGPIPYIGGDIGLFVGLFRLEVSNLVKGLFGLLDTLAVTFDISQLSRYLSIARPLGQELLPLLGMEEIDQRFGTRDELTGPSIREGYLIYGNCPQDVRLAETLWINDGRLMRGQGAGKLGDVSDFDYCVIQIKQRSERNDLATLPFNETWLATKEHLVQGEENKAKAKFTETVRQLALSADLTETHRHELILLYKTKFERGKEVAGVIVPASTVTTRGEATALDIGFSLQNTASIAEEAGYAENVWQGLMRLSTDWQGIPDLDCREPEKEKAVLSRQLQALREITPIEKPDPVSLAEAITVAAFQRG